MAQHECSPDAIKQYLAAQNRVSNWVNHTKQHAPSNPFTPHTRPSSPTKTDGPGSRTRYGYTRSRPASDERWIPQGEGPSSSNAVLESEDFRSSSSSAPSRYTEQSACYTESTYHPHPSITTLLSSHTSPSRHTRKSGKTRALGTHKGHPTAIIIPRSDKKGYIVRVKGDTSEAIRNPLSWKKLEVWVSSSILLLLFLSWWATSENSHVDSVGTTTHTHSDLRPATVPKRNIEKRV